MTEIKINLEILNKPDDEQSGILLQVLGLALLAEKLDRNSEACKWAEAKVAEMQTLLQVYPDHLGHLGNLADALIAWFDRDYGKHNPDFMHGLGGDLLTAAVMAREAPPMNIPSDEELLALIEEHKETSAK